MCPHVDAGNSFFEEHRGNSVSLVHLITRHMMLVCLYMGGINLDHLIKMISPRFLYYKVTIFTFVICGEVLCLMFHRVPQTKMMANA